MHVIYIYLLSDTPFQMKKSFVKATKGTFLYSWAEFAIGRVCNGPRLLWAEFVMGRDVPEPLPLWECALSMKRGITLSLII